MRMEGERTINHRPKRQHPREHQQQTRERKLREPEGARKVVLEGGVGGVVGGQAAVGDVGRVNEGADEGGPEDLGQGLGGEPG